MKFGISLCAGLIATIALLPQARGELVLENDAPQANTAVAPPVAVDPRDKRPEDRENLRGALNASEKVKPADNHQNQEITLPRDLPQGGNTSIIQVQPQVQAQTQSSADSSADLQNSNRSELLRRQRVREEIKNEDLLQERLETLRLRDEQKRTDDLLGTAAPAPVVQAAPQATEVNVGRQAPGAVSQDSVAVSQSVTSYDEELANEDRATFAVMPRAGVSQMTGNSNYDINPHYSLGVGVEIGTGSAISFDVGYTYSEYGVSMASTNPYAQYVQSQTSLYGGNPNFESVAFKQNVVDAGLKLHFLGADSKFRPFVGGGGAYSKGFVNYSQQILQSMDPASQSLYGQDYEISSFLGYLSTGFDVKVSKGITVGALFKYYAVLSSSESQNFNTRAMVGGPAGQGLQYGYPNPQYAVSSVDQDKAAAAGAFSQSSFYSILAGVSFTF